MKEEIGTGPVAYSVITSFWILAGYLFVVSIILPFLTNPDNLFLRGVIRFIFTVPCVIALGKVVQINGIKFVFSMEGFGRGMFAQAALLLWLSTQVIHLINMSEMNVVFISEIPMLVFFELATGVFEEALFRGLFMTAMLNEYGVTVRGRLMSVIVSGVVFGFLHLMGGNMMQVLLTSIIGIAFCAAFLYSKNLTSLMLIHALWNVLIKTVDGLIVDMHSAELLRIVHIAQPIILFAIIPSFALILSAKASPFQTAE